MRPLTTVILAMLLCVCAPGPFSAYAEDTADAVMITAAGSPEVASPDLMSEPSLVAPSDLLSYVDEEYASGLIAEVNAAAAEYGVPVELCWEVIRKESGFHHINASGEIMRSSCNALGICQIIPDGMEIKKRHNVRDRADNIRCMCELLRYALFEREYSLERALGWYNTGSPVINSYARSVAKAYRSWVEEKGGIPL